MDSVKLIRALISLSGGAVPSETDPQILKLKERIGPSEHYLFILMDGLGNYFLEGESEYHFLKERRVQLLRSVFPSTTSSALTSLATGLYPCSHGAIGWWTYLAEHDKTSVYLPFLDRKTGKSLAESGVRAESIYYAPSFFPTLQRRHLSHIPQAYVNSECSLLSRGKTEGRGYKELKEALDASASFALEGDGPSFQYLYYPEVDHYEHSEGVSSSKVREVLLEAQGLLEEFEKKYKGKIRVVISADHGLVDIPPENNLLMGKDHPLMEYLRVPPACEARVPMFFLKDLEKAEAFKKVFAEHYSSYFVLLSKKEVLEKQLLGNESWHELALARLGDFVALPKGLWTLQYGDEDYKPHFLKAYHGALSPEETLVPLILF